MTNTRNYTVLVVEDEPIILQDTINEITNSEMNFQVIGTASNGLEALHMYKELKPDVVFTDIQMPVMNGLQLTKELKELDPDIHIVILSGYSDFEYAQQAIKLGVKEYLLKPLDAEDLTVLLERLYSSLNQIYKSNESNMLLSTLNGMEDIHSLPFCYKQNYFVLFLVGLGNLFHNSLSSSMVSSISSLWEKINWDQLFVHVFGSDQQVWLINELCPNQKYIVFTIDKNSSNEEIHHLANKFLHKLQSCIDITAISICHNNQPISYEKIPDTSQKIRWKLENNFVIGKKVVYSCGNIQDKPISPYLEPNVQNKLKISMCSNNLNILKKDLFSVLEEYDNRMLPQKTVEQNLMQIINLLIHHYQLDAILNSVHVEYVLHTLLFTANSLTSIKEEIWNIVHDLIQSRTLEYFSNEELANQLIEYLKVHFSEDIKVEDLSKHFNFNGTYLARVFKKYTGDSPMKYLIDLRINDAIRLIREREDLDIKLISEMVGYTDPRYFSRIFKARIGTSPSEYRNTVYNFSESK